LKYKNDSLKKQNPNDPNIKDESVLLADAHRAAAPIWAKIPAGETLDIKKAETDIKKRGATTDETRALTDKQREENERRRIATEQGNKINEAMTKWDRSREAIEAKRDGTYETARQKKIDSLRSQLPTVPMHLLVLVLVNLHNSHTTKQTLVSNLHKQHLIRQTQQVHLLMVLLYQPTLAQFLLIQPLTVLMRLMHKQILVAEVEEV
jgi:phage/plasmid-associated DNA primase